MTLGNMRQQGVRGLAVYCLNHACSKSMRARPNWKERTSKAHVVRMMQYPHDIREEVLKIVFERFEEASLVAATHAPTQIASAQIIKKVRYDSRAASMNKRAMGVPIGMGFTGVGNWPRSW